MGKWIKGGLPLAGCLDTLTKNPSFREGKTCGFGVRQTRIIAPAV